MVDTDKGNLKAKVFFIWGSCCFCCMIYAYIFISETKGLTLEQVDRMLEETSPFTSSKWKPHSTFAADLGLASNSDLKLDVEHKDVSSESV
ncbi:unnamed protein product [Ambrosiozyma monospora]|uniref:Unnamed protein product n=1 Tax=Ambrosiozyma monospora TaxID=43982 RepID=A0A9W6T8N4_AMBMO|nr:unnamed protein product [Ambrosiozyma monospora]